MEFILLIIFFLIIGFSFFIAFSLERGNKKSKYIHKIYKTHNGESVKSYGEKAIADYLQKRGIKYEYEHIYVRKDGGINKPDFYLPNFNVYIEYFGMMNYSKKYNFEMHLKFDTFEKEGMKVLKIYKKYFFLWVLLFEKRKLEWNKKNLPASPLV